MTLIKFCGITSSADAEAAVECGADILGLNFYSGSKRFITAETASEIADAIRGKARIAGVFVNSPREEVLAIAQSTSLDYVQFHGDEDADYLKTFIGDGEYEVIQVRRIGEGSPDFEQVSRTILLDKYSPGEFGGTGDSFDWAAFNVSWPEDTHIFLAGGLTTFNVKNAIQITRPYAVDVASGIESAPGKKGSAKNGDILFTSAEGLVNMDQDFTNEYEPDEYGYWGQYGGRYVPETLVAALDELREAFFKFRKDDAFNDELDRLHREFSGRPTPLTFADRLTAELGGARLYFKREDLTHTGAHKINNALGQILLARKMGKKRIIAETGAGQHGVATATVAAKFGLECFVYMGLEDTRRQALNVTRMEMLGATVIPVASGTQTLKDAINEALRDWVTNVETTYYLLGSALGPHPYPLMVRDFQSVIGREAKHQILERESALPDCLIACVGGGSNAIGLFHPFLAEPTVRMVGVEAGGHGDQLGEHAARFKTESGQRVGVLQGTKSYLLQDTSGQIAGTHSVSAGLDYASVGPEHAFLHDRNRVEYTSVTDRQAIDAFYRVSRTEGILPALETSHGLAASFDIVSQMDPNEIVIVNMSGRGDKDVESVRNFSGETQ